MASRLQHNEWSGKTDGLPWMQRLLISILRVLPLCLAYSVMALIVPFYMVFNRKGYKAIYCFFHERLHYGRWKSFRNVYVNHFRFGQIILDRFSMYAGKKFSFTSDNQELMNDLETHPEGFVALSAHVGNFEIAGYSLKPKSKRINVLMYAGETNTIMENRKRLLSQNNMKEILVKEDFSHIFELNAAIENGDILSIYADRKFGSQKYVKCDFFGNKVSFPMGAFAIAVQKKVPVLTIFVMKEGMKTYCSYINKIQCDNQTNIHDQIVELAQNYADNLELTVRKYPTQWFNYYDFWKQ